MNSIDINNNSHNKFVNLSHVLLHKIVNYLDSNIDRICFALVCKKWYQERNKYFIFNLDKGIRKKSIYDFPNFYLKSFRSQLELSLEYNHTRLTCYISNEYTRSNISYDYDFSYDEFIRLKEIPKNIVELYLLKLPEEADYTLIFKQIASSNIQHLDFGQNDYSMIDIKLIQKYLKNIKTIAIENTSFPLEVGSLPENLDKLDLGFIFNHPIKPNSLPNTLRTLELSSDYQHDIGNNILPNLTCLSLYSSYGNSIDEDGGQFTCKQLPATLERIINLPILSIKKISEVNKLSWCRISGNSSVPVEIPDNARTIFKNIKSLKINVGNLTKTNLASLLPSGLRSLSLENFPDRLDPGQLPQNLIKLRLVFYDHPLEKNVIPQSVTKLWLINRVYHIVPAGSLPSRLKRLYFCKDYDAPIGPNVIPDSVEELRLGKMNNNPIGVLPKSLKQLDIKFYENILKASVVPPSVETISVSKAFFKLNTLGSFPPTVISFLYYEGYTDAYEVKCYDTNNYLVFRKGYSGLLSGFISNALLNKLIKSK